MPPANTLTPTEQAQLTQTIEMFEVITQSQSHDYQSLEILREAYFKLGREAELIATSKRIAKAYVQMGQLSSAILEYESILQRCPDDEETRQALAEIESKATGLSDEDGLGEVAPSVTRFVRQRVGTRATRGQSEVEDGRSAMQKIFVEGRIISGHDFEACWVQQDWSSPPEEPVVPFLQVLANRNVLGLEKALRVITDKVRLGYLPIGKYDIDIELARAFPSETCLRWCVLPFDRMSKSILVATSNPFNRQAASELEAASSGRLVYYLSPPEEIMDCLRKVFRRSQVL